MEKQREHNKYKHLEHENFFEKAGMYQRLSTSIAVKPPPRNQN